MISKKVFFCTMGISLLYLGDISGHAADLQTSDLVQYFLNRNNSK